MNDSRQHAGIAMERAYRFLLWLMPVVDKFPRSQKYLMGDRIQSLAWRCWRDWWRPPIPGTATLECQLPLGP